ncbi:MAG TPA: DUF1573 domain-containing protein [Chitinophagaceae bacterium]|nr:DUF1573 domain-containing protein [Chitinophagaceae bacterium]
MKYLMILLAISVFSACQTNDKKGLSEEEREKALKDTTNYTSLQWLDSTTLDLGKVPEGRVVEVAYHFKNVGEKPLIITSVSASCGCTVPEKPLQAFAPGDTGVIKAKFDSKGRPHGEASKQIAVYANTNPNFHDLKFNVEITDKQ